MSFAVLMEGIEACNMTSNEESYVMNVNEIFECLMAFQLFTKYFFFASIGLVAFLLLLVLLLLVLVLCQRLKLKKLKRYTS